MEQRRGELIHSDLYDHYEQDESFYSMLGSAFTYPLRDRGWLILLAGIIFFFLAEFLSFIPVISIFIAVFTTGYIVSFLTRVIITSSDGDETLPDWPDFENFYEDIIVPIFRWAFVLAVSFGPGIFLIYKGMGLAAVAALAVGLVYLPMALTAASIHESAFSANPLVVIPAILKVPIQYTLTTLMLGMLSGVSAYLQWRVEGEFGLLSGAAILAVFLYFAVVQCRLMGLLYFANDETINWFEEANRYYR